MPPSVSLDGLHPRVMRPRVEAVLADPEAKALGLYVVSAFRSIDYQRGLYADAVKRYGSPAAAAKWVAPPGKSNHGPSLNEAGDKVTDQARDGRYGAAVDLGIPGIPAVEGQWPTELERRVNALAARLGLFSPMEYEDWHFEPIPNWTPPTSAATEEYDDMALIPSWSKVKNGRWPAMALLERHKDAGILVAAFDGIPLAPNLDKIPAPHFEYGQAFGVPFVKITGAPFDALGLAEAPDHTIVVVLQDGGTLTVAVKP